jgi:hypothetical protein
MFTYNGIIGMLILFYNLNYKASQGKYYIVYPANFTA